MTELEPDDGMVVCEDCPFGGIRHTCYRASRRQRFVWWLGDLEHWAGYNADPATFSRPTAWMSFHWFQVYASPWKIAATWLR